MISLIKKARKDLKVKIVAVAKDEGAYFAEWIHHHLYLGFDEIEIYVNRSTDNSLEVLSNISKQYDQVKFTTADWVDLCPEAARSHIQQIVYALALHKAKDEGFDYVMFIDVDEFYMPNDIKTGIKDKLAQLKYPESVSFQWFNELGQNEAFSVLPSTISGFRHRLIKSIISTRAPINSMSLHLPRFKGGKKLLCDGSKFIPAVGHHEQLEPSLSKLRDTMIVHRMFRSPLEYVSMLSRGRPSKTHLTIKTNRFGYNIDKADIESFVLDKEAYSRLQDSFTLFLETCQLRHELEASRAFVKKRYKQTIDAIPNIPVSAAKEACRAFRQCDINVVKAVSRRFGENVFLLSISTPILLADLATMFVSIDVETAKRQITRALELHPTGPRIKKLYAEIMSMDNSVSNNV